MKIEMDEEVLRLKTLCLAQCEVKLPRADEHAALLFNGLGARRWQISMHCDSLSFRKAILSIYPRLKTVNGYNLWFINKEKRFQVIPEKVNNPRRIKNFLSTFNAECLLIIPVSNIQLMEENLEKLEKRNEELSSNTKYTPLKERGQYPVLAVCLICGSTGGGCDGALETVDSVMEESSKIADKIFNFLGIRHPGKSEHLYRGKKICRRCLIAATELSDMDDSTDGGDSRSVSGDDSSSSIAKEDCQTQPLDFSSTSSSIKMSESPPPPAPNADPPPPVHAANFFPGPHHAGGLALCNPVYTRKSGTVHPMVSQQRMYPRSQTTGGGGGGPGLKPVTHPLAAAGGGGHLPERAPHLNHNTSTSTRHSKPRVTLPYSHVGRSIMDPSFVSDSEYTSRVQYPGYHSTLPAPAWQPSVGHFPPASGADTPEQRAAISAQLFLAHKSANLGVPGLYRGLFRRPTSISLNHEDGSSPAGLQMMSPSTPPDTHDAGSDRSGDEQTMLLEDAHQSPVRDGLNSTGSGSPESSAASSDCTEEDVANEKRKPMKKRKFSSCVASEN